MKNLSNKVMIGTNTSLMSICLLLVRCTVGILLFIVGSGKVLGWFGGYGIRATLIGYSKMGFSVPLAYLSSYTEFIGGFLLTIGLLARPAAIAVTINMFVAVIVKLPSGILGPNGAQTPIIFLVMAVIIVLTGPMAFSIDSILFRNRSSGN